MSSELGSVSPMHDGRAHADHRGRLCYGRGRIPSRCRISWYTGTLSPASIVTAKPYLISRSSAPACSRQNTRNWMCPSSTNGTAFSPS